MSINLMHTCIECKFVTEAEEAIDFYKSHGYPNPKARNFVVYPLDVLDEAKIGSMKLSISQIKGLTNKEATKGQDPIKGIEHSFCSLTTIDGLKHRNSNEIIELELAVMNKIKGMPLLVAKRTLQNIIKQLDKNSIIK